MPEDAPSEIHQANNATDRLQALLNICQKMNTVHDQEALLEMLAREAARLMNADRASIFILDRESNELWSQVALGSEPLRFASNLGVVGATVQTGRTHNVPDTRVDKLFYSAIDAQHGYHTQNLLAVPLYNYETEIIGAFEVLNKHEGVFTTDDEALLTALASQAAIAIETAHLIQGLQQQRRDLSARLQALGATPAKAGRLINIMGSKGGIGTTTVAVNLAVSLQQANADKSVVVVDVNQPFGDVALFLDLEPARTFSDVMRHVDDLDYAFLQGVLVQHDSGVYVLSAPNVESDDDRLTSECIEKTLALLQTSFDYVILDSGHAMDEVTGAILQLAAPLYLVTILSLPVLRNMDRFIKIIRSELNYTNSDFRIIVNRYKSKKQEVSLHDLEELVKQKPFCLIPNDYELTSEAIYRGESLAAISRRAKISKSFRKLAASLMAEDEADG